MARSLERHMQIAPAECPINYDENYGNPILPQWGYRIHTTNKITRNKKLPLKLTPLRYSIKIIQDAIKPRPPKKTP